MLLQNCAQTRSRCRASSACSFYCSFEPTCAHVQPGLLQFVWVPGGCTLTWIIDSQRRGIAQNDQLVVVLQVSAFRIQEHEAPPLICPVSHYISVHSTGQNSGSQAAVVIWRQPGHFTSMKKLFLGSNALSRCMVISARLSARIGCCLGFSAGFEGFLEFRSF